jgi:hypothetical protein
MRQVCFVLLMCLLPMLSACAAPVYPRYQPVAEDSLGAARLCKNCFGTVPQHGYSDYQIDECTYLVTYQGFNPAGTGSWRYLSHEEWIEMAHDYVLYRAAELARNKGAKQFVILHRDDSNQAWRVWESYRDRYGRYTSVEVVMGYTPGARVLIRLLPNDGAAYLGSGDHVHEVDSLLAVLMKGNARLAAQLETAAAQENVRASKSRFIRWRAPVLIENTALERSLTTRQSSLLDADITEESHGVFGIVLWSRLPLSAIDLLRQGVKTADQEGYEVFKLVNWTTEEYRYGRHWNNWNDRNAWFRTKARLVLQHQREPNSLDPVFAVDEIRNNVMR